KSWPRGDPWPADFVGLGNEISAPRRRVGRSNGPLLTLMDGFRRGRVAATPNRCLEPTLHLHRDDVPSSRADAVRDKIRISWHLQRSRQGGGKRIGVRLYENAFGRGRDDLRYAAHAGRHDRCTAGERLDQGVGPTLAIAGETCDVGGAEPLAEFLIGSGADE